MLLECKMALWKVSGKQAQPVTETTFADERISEERLEDWVHANPEILGEPLLVIGRQVAIEELHDRIDLLALDPEGRVVVIELKRADMKAPVDIQGLRYASYVSGWTPDQLQEVAAGTLGESGEDFSLDVAFARFAESHGVEDVPELNTDQRVIIVGQRVRDRLGSVALWLREKGVDIKLIEIRPFRDGEALYLEPHVIIPPPSTEKWERVGSRVKDTAKPWLSEGEAFHRGRYGNAAVDRARSLANRMIAAGLAEEVSFAQKHYVAVLQGGSMVLRMEPRATRLYLTMRLRRGHLDLEEAARRLGLQVYDSELGLGDKLAIPSSITINERHGRKRVLLRLLHDYDIEGEAVLAFIGDVLGKHS